MIKHAGWDQAFGGPKGCVCPVCGAGLDGGEMGISAACEHVVYVAGYIGPMYTTEIHDSALRQVVEQARSDGSWDHWDEPDEDDDDSYGELEPAGRGEYECVCEILSKSKDTFMVVSWEVSWMGSASSECGEAGIRLTFDSADPYAGHEARDRT